MTRFGNVILAAIAACTLAVSAVLWHLHAKRSHARELAERESALFQRAQNGDPKAEYDLAEIYYRGDGGRRDYTKCAEWSRKAADQGYAKAQNRLGTMYRLGQGMRLDYKEAARWYRRAAEQGDPSGEANLSLMYFYGKGVPLDYGAAR